MEQEIKIAPKEIGTSGQFTTGGTATVPQFNPIDGSNIPVAETATTAPIDLSSPVDEATPTIEGDVAFFQQQTDLAKSNEEKALAQQQDTGNQQLTSLLSSLSGEGAEQLVLEEQNVNPLQTQIADLTSQANVEIAEYRQLEQQFEAEIARIEEGAGRKGITTSALLGQQGAIRRAKAAELNVKASTIGLLQAQSLALQGKADLAQKQVDRAIDLKYKGIENEIRVKEFQLSQIRESLNAEQQKRADAMNFALKRDAKRVEERKANDKEIQSIALKLAEFGVDPSIIKDATTPMEAIQMAGKKLQDPRAKLQLQSLRLDIQQKQREASYFSTYGNLTPAQYNKQIEDDRKGKIDAKEDVILLDTSINQVETILNSSALDSVVGANIFSRGIARQKGLFSKAAAFVGTLGISGTGAEISGKADDTVALTQQMLDQQFLDKLIAVKSKGATFGALSDNEGNALRNAANAIAGTAIKTGSNEKGDLKTIGYDMSESEFKKQMSIIQDSMRRARERSTGELFSTEEQAELDNIFGSEDALVADYSVYFNQ